MSLTRSGHGAWRVLPTSPGPRPPRKSPPPSSPSPRHRRGSKAKPGKRRSRATAEAGKATRREGGLPVRERRFPVQVTTSSEPSGHCGQAQGEQLGPSRFVASEHESIMMTAPAESGPGQRLRARASESSAVQKLEGHRCLRPGPGQRPEL